MDYWTAFILGLVGSVHCAGMCGPLALALPATGGGRVRFLAGRVAYNLGRILTYCLLGVLFGLIGRSLVLAGLQRWISIALGLLLLVGLFSSRKFAFWRPVAFLLDKIKRNMSFLLQRRSALSLGILGVLNGFLPCGLVYVAGAAATASGSPAGGFLYMAIFGLGTVPMLLAVSHTGRLLPLAWRAHLRKAIPASVFILAALLILRGLGLGIAFLSPDLTAQNCCHK